VFCLLFEFGVGGVFENRFQKALDIHHHHQTKIFSKQDQDYSQIGGISLGPTTKEPTKKKLNLILQCLFESINHYNHPL